MNLFGPPRAKKPFGNRLRVSRSKIDFKKWPLNLKWPYQILFTFICLALMVNNYQKLLRCRSQVTNNNNLNQNGLVVIKVVRSRKKPFQIVSLLSERDIEQWDKLRKFMPKTECMFKCCYFYKYLYNFQVAIIRHKQFWKSIFNLVETLQITILIYMPVSQRTSAIRSLRRCYTGYISRDINNNNYNDKEPN